MIHSILPTHAQEDLFFRIEKGYDEAEKNNAIKASEIWLGAWTQIKEVMETYRFSYVEDLDEALKDNTSLFNWSQDLEMELFSASMENREYLQERLDFCSEYLSKSKSTDDLSNLVRRRVVAESYFMLGDSEKGEKLFQEHVRQFPEDAFGWINWSDQYGLFAENEQIRDYDKAISILKQALKVPGLDERIDTLIRLEDTYKEIGMEKEAEDVRREIEMAEQKKREEESEQMRQLRKQIERDIRETPTNQKNKNQAVKQLKIGRNEPCPCGSGKKYKKCCGK